MAVEAGPLADAVAFLHAPPSLVPLRAFQVVVRATTASDTVAVVVVELKRQQPTPALPVLAARGARMVAGRGITEVAVDMAGHALPVGAYCLHAALVGVQVYAAGGLGDDTYEHTMAHAQLCGLAVTAADVQAAKVAVEAAAAAKTAAEAVAEAEKVAAHSAAHSEAYRVITAATAAALGPALRDADTGESRADTAAGVSETAGGKDAPPDAASPPETAPPGDTAGVAATAPATTVAANAATATAVLARVAPHPPSMLATHVGVPVIGSSRWGPTLARWRTLVGVPPPAAATPHCALSQSIRLLSHAVALPAYSTVGVERNASLLNPSLSNTSGAWSVSVHFTLAENCTHAQCSVFHRVEAGKYVRTPALFVKGQDQSLNLQVNSLTAGPFSSFPLFHSGTQYSQNTPSSLCPTPAAPAVVS